MRLEKKLSIKFIKSKSTLAVAESCTGGLIGDRLTNIAGASAYFLLGVVAYSNAAKTQTLGVPSVLIKKHGAVSPQVALAMAKGVRKILKSDFGLSVTGIAGPAGGSQQKPVGLVFIALSTSAKTTVKKYLFDGTRMSIKKQACQRALKMLAKII